MRTRMKRLTSLFLALVMVFTLIPPVALAAGVNESLVSSLAAIYDGDEERARAELDALYEAGIIDADGNMAPIDIREDGESVELSEVAQRIMDGGTVGALTVNGRAVTPEKILQIQQVSSMLEVIRLIDKDVEITDEHVANLESLIAGIADGSIDLSDVISRGEVRMNANRSMRMLGAANVSAVPTSNTGTGEVENVTDGKYTAPLISGSSYEAEHNFTLIDPENKTWYTDSVVTDAVVTITCAESTGLNRAFTVKATLNKAQSVPVSFDWSAVSDVIAMTGETSGTVAWEANDTELEKTFSVTLGAKSGIWVGTQCFVINAGNIKNATFADGKTAWSHTVSVSANDDAAVKADTAVKIEPELTNEDQWWYAQIDNFFPSDDGFKISFEKEWDGLQCSIFLAAPDFNFHMDSPYDSPFQASQGTKYGFWRDYGTDSYNMEVYQAALENFTFNNLDGSTKLQQLNNLSKNGKIWVGVKLPKSGYSIRDFKIEIFQTVTENEVKSVTVPAGTYYSGEVVPVTVTLKYPVKASSGTTLTVNDKNCPMLNSADTEAKTFTFGYTVKEIDSGALNVTALSNTFKNRKNGTVSFTNSFPTANFSATSGNVEIHPDVKLGGLDWANVKYGIDDADPGDQTVTMVIPFVSGADKTWIANETVEINSPVSMPVPGYASAEAAGYLKSAYFSPDGGAIRYPIYVLGDNADALAVRFSPAMNATAFLRKDTLSLYLDTEVGAATDYLGAWADKQEDAKGFAYFTATDSAAPPAAGKSYSYYVKGSVAFDKDETIGRPNYDAANIMKDAEDNALGFYKENALYVAVQGDDASKQHDVELVANEALYKAAANGVRAEDPNTLTLSYQTSSRDSFTFTAPKFFTWTSSDRTIADVTKDEQTGAGRITLNGNGGAVTITLTVGNGSASKAYDLTFTFTVLEGKTPFFNIPEFSRERVTLTETDTEVLFASNVTQRNAGVGTPTTTFAAKLYKVSAVGETPTGEGTDLGNFGSTVENTLTHITVPGTALTEAGIYAVVISTRYVGGTINGVTTAEADFSATAYLTVKQAPVKVTLNKLDSYSVDYKTLPTIGYTVTPSNANATVEYTIQKSGEEVGTRTAASGGTIPFTAAKPTGLKDAYTVTVYAKATDAAADEPWSVDSMLLRVYNTDMLELIVKDVVAGEIGGTTGGTGENVNGKTVKMDNHSKVENYAKVEGKDYQLSVSDLNALRTDMSLQKIISANYGSGVWGLLSDKMQWSSSNSDLVSVNYKQGGFYSDIRNYSYTSYGPATDFLLVGKGDTGEDGVTITATHAGTGKTASVTVAANTLKDQLYIFQFNPKAETNVVYTNGADEKRSLKSDENGVLAVYEPEGIATSVMAMSEVEEEGSKVTYVGTIFQNELQSGERDIASLQLYPTNNLRLRSISNATLTFRNPDGSAYNGKVTLRAGVYKNGVYCPGAEAFLASAPETKYGAQNDIVATVTDGKLSIGFDPTQFKNNPNDTEENGAYPGDKVTYVFEYRVEGYQTSYTMLNVYTDAEGEQRPTDSVIQLRSVKGGAGVPQITRQTIQQYSGDEPLPYTRDVIDYTENIGLSNKINQVVLTTDYVLPTNTVVVDNGQTTLSGEFALYTTDGHKLTDQTDGSSAAAVTINKLADLKGASLFVFPFSSTPIGHYVYTMTDKKLKEVGITDEGENPTTSTRVRAMFVRDGMTVTSLTLPFGISNLSHQKSLDDPDSGVKEMAEGIQTQLKNQMSIGAIFKEINVNDMLKKGFTFLSGLTAGGGDTPFSIIILPTEDPGIFRIVAFVGVNQDKNKDNKDGVDIEYDEDAMYEDFAEMMEEDDDDDEEDGEGEGSVDASFSGTLVLEAGYDINKKEWKIDFRGGSVGLGISAKYEWSQNFVVGPVPATISFEVGANVDLEVSFATKSSVKLMLVDATVGVYIEAFAGLGFDATIAKLKLGIYGRIGADVNFLLLSDFKGAPPTGTKLDINGEIGIRLEVKVLFVNYKKTFASTGFNWSKKWNKYDEIQTRWAQDGNAELFGVTQSGRAYSMLLFANGTALVTIEGGGEIENRDYLELAERTWNSGTPSGRRLLRAAGPMTNALTDVQTNAYPYSNPVFSDDGSVFLYISDNDNPNEPQSVVSYAVKGSNGYDNKGRLEKSDSTYNILPDTDVVASGADNKIFAAWVKQHESPEKEMKDKATYDDLGMMMNATEIYAGSYNGTDWTTERLTENNVADMSPTVASSGNRAIVAWRSLSATKMPEEGGAQDISTMFNAENNVNYRVYDGTNWKDAQVAYNGASGTVNAIDSAMLSDGTAILVYTVRTGDDITSTETFYTVIGTDGNVLTTGRMTNDSYTDTNAQVTTVGDQFVLGWYSEHETGETVTASESGVEEAVVAHDIRLTRINKDGSVDESFPESIGGDSASAITSDFRFSAPANNTDLSKLSIVWSQKMDSEKAEDAGKYEINAMRFYEAGGTVGMSTQVNIAKTGKNVTVDHFDTYTDADASGKVYALVLASDYSSVNGIEAFDRIDLTNLPVQVSNGGAEPSSSTLTILEQNSVAGIKLGSATFPETAVEVTADTNLRELVPGLDLPVQFTVKNTGTSTVNEVNVQLGTVNKAVNNLALLPNQSTIITVVYPVPEGAVQDVNYTVTAGEATETGTLVLNRPDVGISGMKLLSEADGERTVQTTLSNASGIPLEGSGKTVKLGLYTAADHEEENRVGAIITISDAKDLADIDEGIYGAVQTLKVENLIDEDAKEIPDSGIRLYARAWLEDADNQVSDELYSRNNDGTLAFKGLLTKNNGEIVTTDTSIESKTVNEATEYTVHADIRNNSLQEQKPGIPVAVLLDDKGEIIAQKNFQNDSLTLGGEKQKSLSVTFAATDIGDNAAPASAALRFIRTVTFDVNGGTGTIAPAASDFDGHITLPENNPTPPAGGSEQLFFSGWYTDRTAGDKIDESYTFTGDTTVYARYVTHQHDLTYSTDGKTVTAICANTNGVCYLPEDPETHKHTATLTIAAPTLSEYGTTDGQISAGAVITDANGIRDGAEIKYYLTDDAGSKTGEALAGAPTDAGRYWAEITLDEGNENSTAHVVYTIDRMLSGVTRYGDTLTAAQLTGATYSWERLDAENSASGTAIAASGNTYRLTADDVGKYIRVSITLGDEMIKRVAGPVTPTQYLKPILSETKTVTTTNSIQINGFYNASTLEGARYQYSVDGGEPVAISSIPFTISAEPNKTYSVVVQGVEVRKGDVVLIEEGAPSVALTVKTPAKMVALTGVSINGTAQVGGTLTAAVTGEKGGIPTGVTYQWYRGSDLVSGATSTAYTLTGEDYGKTVTVRATGMNNTAKEAATATTVTAAPAADLTGKNINTTATQTSIKVLGFGNTSTRHYEYSCVPGENAAAPTEGWKSGNEFTGLTAYTPYTVFVRMGGAAWQATGETIKANAKTLALPLPYTGTASTVSMTDYTYGDVAPTPSVTGMDEGAVATYEYRKLGATDWTAGTPGSTLAVGTHEIRAKITKSGCSDYITEAINFTVSPTQLSAPTVSADGVTVTVGENAPESKKVQYVVVAKDTSGDALSTAQAVWKTAMLDDENQFELTGLKEGYDYDVYVRSVPASGESNYTVSEWSAKATGKTPETKTVVYDLNGGKVKSARTFALTATFTEETYKLADGAAIERSGYTFDGWKLNNEGDAVTEASSGGTYFAQWKKNTYTVSFDPNGGKGEMPEQSDITYGEPTKLDSNTFTYDGHVFAGWATTKTGAVRYGDGQTVMNLTAGESVTLYAVWGSADANIEGTITGAEGGVTEVTLKRGGIQIGETQIAAMAYDADSKQYKGGYTFQSVPDGIYNLVAVQNVERLDQDSKVYTEALTVTSAINIVNGKIVTGSADFTMPASDYSSIITVSGIDTPPVVVSGLNDEAESSKLGDRSVTVTMTVEKQEETNADAETKDAIDAIASAANAPTEEREYLNIDVKKEITKNGRSESKEAVTRTEKLIKISIPYDLGGKTNAQISLYRFHDGEASKLGTSENETGYYTLDRTHNLIVLHTRLFSTYAIGYNPDIVGSNTGGYGGGGSGGRYNIAVNTASNGTVKTDYSIAARGTKVTVTVTPNAGYAADAVTVTDTTGKAVSVTKVNDTTYTFVLPNDKVTVSATFKPASGADALAAFSDVNASDWYAGAVRWAVENGVMNGVGGGKFNPNGETSRGMVVTMLWRLEGSPAYAGASEFADVKSEDWYGQAVRWANAEGIVTGYEQGGSTVFNPNGAVTREQLAAMLYRYAQYKKADVSVGEKTELKGYGDAASVSQWALSAMRWAVASGVINGIDGKLVPAGNATRAQVATMLMRYCTSAAK